MARISVKNGNKKLRYGVIGAGGIAGIHLSEMAKFTDEVEIVALADLNEAGMAKYAGLYKLPKEKCYTDYQEMLAEEKLDAVSVCTPNGLHAANSIAALKAGCHVIVEKPMAMNAAEAQRMIDAAKKARRKLVIGFQMRYDARTQFIKKAGDEGQFGNILYARVQALRRRGIPNWGVFGRKELQGGGPMIDIGVHCLEMCHYAMGSPIPVAAVGKTFTYIGNKPSDKIVCQWPNWDYKTYNVEDLAVGQIRFSNGAVLAIESSFAAHIDKNLWTFQLMGEKGGAQFDPPTIFTDEAGHMVNKTPGYIPTTDFTQLFQFKMRNFVDHVLHDKPTMAPAEHGLIVQKMLDGIYASAARGGKEVLIK